MKDLLDRVAGVMEQLGHVGEDCVKRLAYLVATSRLLAKPLSALLLAPSGTGKSAVLDAVSALMPPESVVTLARLTPQALFYSGPDALRHRLVVVDEYEGQQDADHAVRVLQSRGELRQSVTIKGKAEELVAKGPVSVMSGTTLTGLDPQNTSRCIELALDDSLEQTRRVQAAQAAAWSGARRKALDVQIWHDAQRMLGEEPPVEVAIPFAPKLTFPCRTTADRRASAKLLGLVAALLLSRQRDRDREGRVVATSADYAAVHALLRPSVEHTMDGLSDRAARLYRWMIEDRNGATRRGIAAALGWSYNTAKRALDELVSQELAAVADDGPPATYRLLDRSLLGGGAELVEPAALRRA
jgi:DNA primase